MQRRQFFAVAGMAAINTQGFASATLAASEDSPWQPDGVGSLARIGVLTPDFDPVPESEMWAMAPHGVSTIPLAAARFQPVSSFAGSKPLTSYFDKLAV